MYAKIFAQIFDSSIAEDWQTRHVFEDLLKLSDQDGVVDMTVEAIARRTNVPIEIVQKALLLLELPDPKSRSKIEDGKRILRMENHRDWGWRIVNYKYYRNLFSEREKRQKNEGKIACNGNDFSNDDVTRQKTRERVRRFRERAHIHSSKQGSELPKTACNVTLPIQKHIRTVCPEPPDGGIRDDVISLFPSNDMTPDFVKKAAHYLEDFIRKKRKINFNFKRSKWYKEFTGLLRSLDGDKNRLKRVLKAYVKIPHDRHTPVADSAESFRLKFGKIEDWINRHQEDIRSGEVSKITTFEVSPHERYVIPN